MLRPSYSELMDILNQDAEADNQITSRYSIVIATAKRARQIIDGAEYDSTGVQSDKAVSIAINEIKRGNIKTYQEDAVTPPTHSDRAENAGKPEADKPKPRSIRTSPGVLIDDVSAVKDIGGAAVYNDEADLDLEIDYGDENESADEVETKSVPDDDAAAADVSFGKKKSGRHRDGYVPEAYDSDFTSKDDAADAGADEEVGGFDRYESGDFDDYDYSDRDDKFD